MTNDLGLMMQAVPDIDITVSNIIDIDFSIYPLWLQYIEASEAKSYLLQFQENDCDYNQKDLEFMLYSTILDQYRIYGMIEPMLQYPSTLLSQNIYQISFDSQEKLISDYYQFDEVVVRELLGKKLNKGTRRDLDDIAAKTKKNLKCCQRQFDNCRRVFKAVEDMSGNLVENIQKQFLLPSSLAWNYAAIAFLANQKLECNKRKLQNLPFQNIIECSKNLIENWTVGALDTGSQDVDIELDQEFLHELRSVKIITSDQKLLEKHKSLTLKKMKNMHSAWSDALFRQLSRGIISIAASIYKTKEMRNFFTDIYEKVVDPCKLLNNDRHNFEEFLAAYHKAGLELSQINRQQQQWNRYMKTMSYCAAKMFD